MDTLSATRDYASLLFALPQLQPLTILAVFFLTLARIIPIMALAPFLGAKNAPMAIRLMFSIALVALVLPQNLLSTSQDIPYGFFFAALCLKELAIGFFLGFFAAIPFFVAQMAGSLIDHQRGSAALQVTDPTTQSQTGPIGILYNYALIVLFFALGGPFLFFSGVSLSYQLFPVDQWFQPSFFHLKVPFWNQVLHLIEQMFDLSVRLASPALIGILLTDMFLGIANRLAPQVQIVFLGISLKSWVGIALLAAAWGLVLRALSDQSTDWMHALQKLLEQSGFWSTKNPST